MVKTTSTDQSPSRIWSNLVFTIQCLEDADWLMTLQEHVYSPESLTSDWAVTNATDKEKKLTVYTHTHTHTHTHYCSKVWGQYIYFFDKEIILFNKNALN